jgi:gamma-glutamyltranspeptidase / glutathione hydrolase
MRIYCLLLFSTFFLVLNGQPANSFDYSIQKSALGKNGVVVSAHPLASAAGIEILQKGGNAIDAAITVQLALAVVFPEAGNIGGGGFLVAHMQNGEILAIDFREKAPKQAGKDMYLDSNGNPIEGSSWHGAFSSGVPGTIDGMFEAHKKGRLPFVDLITPAIRLASQGFSITQQEADNLNASLKDFTIFNSTVNSFTSRSVWKAGDTLVQPELALTLERIRDHGRAGFYEGTTAGLIVASCKKKGGIISADDLKSYRSIKRKPVLFEYRGYKVLTMPLPASGGVLLPQMLGMAEQYPLADYGFQSTRAVQLMVEIERRAYADRAKYLGDPDFVKIPVTGLTNRAYLKNRMADFSWDKASKSESIQAGQPKESTETTHFSVIDKDGNAVAVTTTLNGAYGSCFVVEGGGFFLNNEMDDFSIKPGIPNAYGAIGGDANAIAPGKRMLSSMSPTILLKEDKPFLIIGSPGGTTIITSVFQSIVNIVDFKMSLSDAINAPKFHHQWYPDFIRVEKEFPTEVRLWLEQAGHQVKEAGKIGRTDGILRLPDGSYQGVGDRRGDDSAMAY